MLVNIAAFILRLEFRKPGKTVDRTGPRMLSPVMPRVWQRVCVLVHHFRIRLDSIELGELFKSFGASHHTHKS